MTAIWIIAALVALSLALHGVSGALGIGAETARLKRALREAEASIPPPEKRLSRIVPKIGP